MAIKPDDCVIRMQDLIVGTKDGTDWHGHPYKIDRYERYWENFCSHVDKIIMNTPWNGHGKNPHDQVFDAELAKHGGRYKRTKEYKGNYLKFKSHKHLTMFIMRWS